MIKSNLFKLLLALCFSWFVAIISAGRSDLPREFNDTSAYAMHYDCLASGQGVESCNQIIGASPVEFVYQYVARLCSFFINFYLFKMLLAFAISLAIIWSVLMLSPGYILPIFMIISDFRFWEDISNVLRHGLATSVFIVGMTVYVKYMRSVAFYFRYLAIGAHLGSIFLLFASTRRVSKYTLIFAICSAVILVITSQYWIPVVTSFAFSEQKLSFYIINNKDYGFALPLHYFIIVFLGFFFYGKINNLGYIISYNITIILVAGVILLGLIGLSYRAISLMMPFVIICASHQIRYLSSKFKPNTNCAYAVLSLIYGTFFILALIRNIDAFAVHLS